MAGRSGRRTVSDGIVLAQLDWTAGFCVHNHVPVEDAVERLLEIAGDRMGLMNLAAGQVVGAWEVDPVSAWQGWQKANLMLAAGADPEQMKPHRVELAARRSAPHPTPGHRGGGPGNVQGRANPGPWHAPVRGTAACGRTQG